MPSKLKAAPKKTTKPAKACPTPIRFEMPVLDWRIYCIASLLEKRTASQLKEDLRSRGVAIPKNKEDMADRLSSYLAATGAVLTASII